MNIISVRLFIVSFTFYLFLDKKKEEIHATHGVKYRLLFFVELKGRE